MIQAVLTNHAYICIFSKAKQFRERFPFAITTKKLKLYEVN